MIRREHMFFWIVIIILMGGNPMSAQEGTGEKEYALKADFLYRFVDYVYWKNYSKKQTFKIAVLEESLITTSLLDITKNKKIEVKEYKNLNELGFCNILFIPYNCTIPIETILSKFSGKPVLIVTEQNGYGKKGTHVNFVTVDNKLKFEVNLKAINKSGIGISSFLLKHAIIVQ
ncbi:MULTISPECIES: YfiR family protein [Flavobacterium]|uniref:YfiR family protein n=1 Tax=Flavobacterium ranwuense TaxID=2541725 RepID=A0ABY2DZL7_9FLAO|nr:MULTISPECIES: YfiR family protein [Flavobacterium]TDE31436.1 YfiR family protein [Flavobacterium ranwuense]TDE55255.1 YfiR family protein [Flavobacterium sp. GT3P67]